MTISRAQMLRDEAVTLMEEITSLSNKIPNKEKSTLLEQGAALLAESTADAIKKTLINALAQALKISSASTGLVLAALTPTEMGNSEKWWAQDEILEKIKRLHHITKELQGISPPDLSTELLDPTRIDKAIRDYESRSRCSVH